MGAAGRRSDSGSRLTWPTQPWSRGSAERITTMNAVESAVEPSSSQALLLTRAVLDLLGLTLLTITLMVALGT